MKQLIAFACFVLVLIAAASCGEPTALQDVGRPPKPVMSVGDVTGPATVVRSNRNYVPMPWTISGIGLLTGTPYRVKVTGMLSFTPNPDWCAGASPLPSISPSIGPAGFDAFSHAWAAAVGKGDQAVPPGSANIVLSPSSEAASQVTGLVQGPGVLWTSRSIAPLFWNCSVGGTGPVQPGWWVSGDQQLVAEELPQPEAVPDKNLVDAGDTVRFDLQIPWTTTYFVRGGWRWVPDATTNTSTFVTPCGGATTCRVIVRERGHVEVDDIVIEGGQLDLNAKSRVIEIGTARVQIRSTTGVLAVYPAGTGGTAKLTLEVSVVGVNGTPLKNRSVSLSVDGDEGSGGHNHGGTMPPGGLSPTTVKTGSRGIGTTTYSAGVFGGTVQVTGVSSGAASAHETITVRVPGLVELFEAGNVDTIGPLTVHPSNHWGTPAMTSSLIALADAFNAYTTRNGNPKMLQVNDMSLMLGGKFDVYPPPINYNPNGDHKEHYKGTSADVRYNNLDDYERSYLVLWWVLAYGVDNVYIHPVTSNNPHFHFRVP